MHVAKIIVRQKTLVKYIFCMSLDCDRIFINPFALIFIQYV